MLGAIIGDIVGSRFEFNPTNDYNFELFTKDCGFTDDTICTIAVADAVLHGKDYSQTIHEWCRRYPNPMGSYGGRFKKWVMSDDPKPYNSFGNGSAMRVSPIAWFYEDNIEVIETAEQTALCTHNHPEGIRGAEVVAITIWRALSMLKGFETINQDAIDEAIYFAEDQYEKTEFFLEDVQNKFDETCQGTVPVAIWIIRHSTSFEDAIRKAVSLGADADTLGAIVGSIAEAIWGIPEWMKKKAFSYLTKEMLDVLNEFRKSVHWHLPKSIKAETVEKQLPTAPKPIKTKEEKSDWELLCEKYPNELKVIRDAGAFEIVMAVDALHKKGYEQLRLISYMSPNGCAWRWHIYPKSYLDAVSEHEGYCERVQGPHPCPYYSTASTNTETKIEDLVSAIEVMYAEMLADAKFADPDYISWYQQIIEGARNNCYSEAIGEWFTPDEGWRLGTEIIPWPPHAHMGKCILRTQVAGWSFHEGDSVSSFLTCGKRLRLIREAGNTHDHNAVAVYFSNKQIGYIPKKDNKEIAQLFDEGKGNTIQARITWANLDDEKGPAIHFNIYKNI